MDGSYDFVEPEPPEYDDHFLRSAVRFIEMKRPADWEPDP